MNMSKKVKNAFKKLGVHIQKLREERKISISELSQFTGIRIDYLKKIENGTAFGVMLERHLAKIAQALKIRLYELFDYE